MSGAALPVIKNSSNGIIIRHKEYLGDINPSSTFNVTSFPINPGIEKSFPWLSQIASSFEEYEFRGLIFQFRSMSSDAVLASQANTSLGTVIMATEYNVVLPSFATKAQMENHEFAISCKPSCSLIHPIECARGQTPVTRLFIRNQPVETGADPRLYDLGNFQIATQGMQNISDPTENASIGELWASYEIKFFKPKISDTPTTGIDFFQSQNTIASDNGVDNEHPFGTQNTAVAGSSGQVFISSGNQVKFAPWLDDGYWLMTYYCAHSEPADHGHMTIAGMTNCAIVAIWERGVTQSNRAVCAPTSTPDMTSNEFCGQFVMKITGPTVNEQTQAGFTFKLSNTVTAGAGNCMHFVAARIPPQLGNLYTASSTNLT